MTIHQVESVRPILSLFANDGNTGQNGLNRVFSVRLFHKKPKVKSANAKFFHNAFFRRIPMADETVLNRLLSAIHAAEDADPPKIIYCSTNSGFFLDEMNGRDARTLLKALKRAKGVSVFVAPMHEECSGALPKILKKALGMHEGSNCTIGRIRRKKGDITYLSPDFFDRFYLGGTIANRNTIVVE